MELSGLGFLSFDDRRHRRGQDAAGADGYQQSGVNVVDAVSQGGKYLVVRIIVGHRADACHRVSEPRPQFIGAVRHTGHRLRRHCHLTPVPQRLDGHGAAAVLAHRFGHLVNGVHRLVFNFGDDVPLLQTALLGRPHAAFLRFDLRQRHHHNALGKELDAHRPSHWDQCFLRLCLTGAGHRRWGKNAPGAGRLGSQPYRQHHCAYKK